MIFVNFKTYEQGTGEKAIELAKMCQEVEKETGVKIVPIVQAADIFQIAALGIEVWAQHVDDAELGQHTGMIPPKAVADDGAGGVLLNHSEDKLNFETILICKVLKYPMQSRNAQNTHLRMSHPKI